MGPLSEKVLTLRRQKHRRPKTEDLTPEDMYETAFRVKVRFYVTTSCTLLVANFSEILFTVLNINVTLSQVNLF